MGARTTLDFDHRKPGRRKCAGIPRTGGLTGECEMAKLRHIAMSVDDPEKTADFYCDAFDMKRVGRTDSPLAKGCYVSDGVITVALLKY